MPNYDFKCEQCSVSQELYMPMSEATNTEKIENSFKKECNCKNNNCAITKVYSVNLGTFSAMSAENKQMCLTKRSKAHSEVLRGNRG